MLIQWLISLKKNFNGDIKKTVEQSKQQANEERLRILSNLVNKGIV